MTKCHIALHPPLRTASQPIAPITPTIPAPNITGIKNNTRKRVGGVVVILSGANNLWQRQPRLGRLYRLFSSLITVSNA
ncbi:MAG: hypothetical protein IJB03_00075 [Alistipes sp.]|nr:hypothetical protein [Alistipes sp.]